MIANPQINSLSSEDYLVQEQQCSIKHEYVNGHAYAMAGASDSHVTIALNMALLLKTHLRRSGCRVFMSDMKVRVEASNSFYCPDVFVTCDERDRGNSSYKLYPRLIVEVLSSSTEAFDRGDKFADYQQIDTLQDYLLVSTTRTRVDAFHREAHGLWTLQSLAPPQNLIIKPLGLDASMDALYEDIAFDA